MDALSGSPIAECMVEGERMADAVGPLNGGIRQSVMKVTGGVEG